MMPESNKSTQKFITEGSKINVGSKKSTYHRAIPGQNLLGLGGNWVVSADLLGWPNDYPKIISSKGLQSDIVLFSKANSKVILVELTIPFESRQEIATITKQANMKISKNNWKRKGITLK